MSTRVVFIGTDLVLICPDSPLLFLADCKPATYLAIPYLLRISTNSCHFVLKRGYLDWTVVSDSGESVGPLQHFSAVLHHPLSLPESFGTTKVSSVWKT